MKSSVSFKILFISLSLLCFHFLFPGVPESNRGKSFSDKAKNATGFLENKGQINQTDGKPAPYVSHVLERGNTKLFLLKQGGIAYQFEKIHYPENYNSLTGKKFLLPEEMKKKEELQKQVRIETFRMDMELENANPNAEIISEGRSEDYINYYNHNALDVHHYQKVIYKKVYPGIDWVIYTTEKGMKYDFVVKPGADPSQIRLKFSHQEQLRLNEKGQLIHGNSMGTFTEDAPVSFQEGKEITTKFILKENILSFDFSDYDKTKTLTIDPNRIWATYYGGNSQEFSNAVKTDGAGNVYLGGQTASSTNIASSGFQNTIGAGGDWDAFLVKFNSSGVRQWATYYGGSGGEYTYSISSDNFGNVYLAGSTNSTDSIFFTGHQAIYGGYQDAFLVKFDSNGNRIWATYYGGAGSEEGTSVTTDASGNVFLSGNTSSINNIGYNGYLNTFTASSSQINCNNQIIIGSIDAFLVKFNSAGIRQWGTYYGGTENDFGSSCATDLNGNVYLAGKTTSFAQIATPNAHQTSILGCGDVSDAFLVKFNSTGIRQWGTYYGGSNWDEGNCVQTDSNGNVYLSGLTTSTSAISYLGHQNIYGGGEDGYVVKFNSNGQRQWGTYYGGLYNDAFYGMSINSQNNIYLTGETDSYNGIQFNGFQKSLDGNVVQNMNGGYTVYSDAFLVSFNDLGTRQWGTYFGGSNKDAGYSVSADNFSNVFLSGETYSLDSISYLGHQDTLGSVNLPDAFLVKFQDNCFDFSASASNTGPFCEGTKLQLYASGGNTYSWSGPNGFTSSLQYPFVNNSTPNMSGNYTVLVSDSLGCSATATTSVTVIPNSVNISVLASPQAGAAPLLTAFNNNTPNRTNYSWYWTFGDGTSSSSNAQTVFHNYNYPGLYDVSLVATSLNTGCADTLFQTGFIYVTGTASCNHAAVVTPTGTVTICSGDSVVLTCNTASSFTYQWNYNSVAIAGATSSTYLATLPGYYSVTIMDNGCPITSAASQIQFSSGPVAPTITQTGSILPCVGGTVTLSASGGNGNYLWSNGALGNTIIVSTSGTFYVSSIDPSSGCISSSDPITINGSASVVPEICMVTVDSLSQHNIIYWDKTLYSALDTFCIYRDISNNNYQLIGKVAFTSQSQFTDTLLSLYPADGNPNVSSWRYKLSGIDTCGNESAMSAYHQTIFIQNNGGNFSWNHYQIEGLPAPVPALMNYVFYRDDLSNGNWQPIQTLSASSTAFTDPSFAIYQGFAGWRVETQWNITCNPSLRLKEDENLYTLITTSRSNVKNSLNTLGVTESKDPIGFAVYPNPAANNVTISLNASVKQTITIRLLDVRGREVKNEKRLLSPGNNQEIISVQELSSGIYFVECTLNNNVLRTKLVKE